MNYNDTMSNICLNRFRWNGDHSKEYKVGIHIFSVASSVCELDQNSEKYESSFPPLQLELILTPFKIFSFQKMTGITGSGPRCTIEVRFHDKPIMVNETSECSRRNGVNNSTKNVKWHYF